MPTTVLKAEELTDGGIGILTLMVRCGLSPSNGEHAGWYSRRRFCE